MEADLAEGGSAVRLELETGELIEKIEDLPEIAKVFVKMQGPGADTAASPEPEGQTSSQGTDRASPLASLSP